MFVEDYKRQSSHQKKDILGSLQHSEKPKIPFSCTYKMRKSPIKLVWGYSKRDIVKLSMFTAHLTIKICFNVSYKSSNQ